MLNARGYVRCVGGGARTAKATATATIAKPGAVSPWLQEPHELVAELRKRKLAAREEKDSDEAAVTTVEMDLTVDAGHTPPPRTIRGKEGEDSRCRWRTAMTSCWT